MFKSSLEQRSSLYLAEDTIHSIISGHGGAIQVVRISGPLSLKILKHVTQLHKEITPRKAYFANFFAEAKKLDEGLFVFFKGPNSFTGEDTVEFSLHGSRFIAEKFLKELTVLGSRQSLPGEFSFRAVRNGKISITQAQAIADLIGAQNDGAVTLALEKMGGTQNKLVQELYSELLNLATYGELGIDFSDQDIEELEFIKLKDRTRKTLGVISHLSSTFERGIRIQEGISAAFVGLPNAGKSSLFNELLGEDRSIVSSTPGTTRDVVGETLSLKSSKGSITFRLNDTAGIRTVHEQGDQIEKIGIEKSEKSIFLSDLVFFVAAVDSDTTDLEQLIFRLKEIVGRRGQSRGKMKILPIITKVDLGEEREAKVRNLLHQHFGVVFSVSVFDIGSVQKLIQEIVEFTIELIGRTPEEVIITNREQSQALLATMDDLERALVSPSLDLFAADVRQALYHLEPLIGQSLADDILTRIFSQFCIGK